MKTLILKETQALYTLTLDEATLAEGPVRVLWGEQTIGVLVATQVRFRRLEVIAFPEEYMLLGRDVLNHFYARLNGPDLMFDLSPVPPE